MYKHILIPTDGSELSAKAIEHGITLAKSLGATITALTVSEPFSVSAFEPSFVDRYKKHVGAQAEKHLEAARDAARAAGVNCELARVEHDRPYQAIIDAARERGCDVIVMASHGRSGVSAIVLGSETLKVLTHSTVPVVVVRGEHGPPYFAAS